MDFSLTMWENFHVLYIYVNVNNTIANLRFAMEWLVIDDCIVKVFLFLFLNKEKSNNILMSWGLNKTLDCD